jgi:acyl-CoA synthetase (NDP forming)
MTSSADIIQTALQQGRAALFEHEAKELARSAGIVVPRFALVGPDDVKAATAAADSLGYPVALKAESPDILHKTDAGAVMLNLANAAALTASIGVMKNMIASRVSGAVIKGFLIEKMMPAGLELLIGGLRDPQFGTAVSFGLGGIYVEALRDVAFGVLPMTHEEIREMISATRAAVLLRGFRNAPALDEEALHLIVANVAGLLDKHPEIQSMDLNPVRVYARGAVALDVRVVIGAMQK